MSAHRARAVRTVLWWTLALNLAVAAGKIGYGYFSDALAIRADGFHSLPDAANNIIGLVSVSLASQPPDREHPYGHHRFEALAAGLVGASLLAIAFDVIRGAAERLTGTAPALPRIDAAAFVVLIVTLVVNVAVARYERREAKRLASSFLESDAAHTHADVIVTVGVIVAAAMVKLGYIVADLVAAIAVAGFVAWAGVSVLWRNLVLLADTAQIDPARVEGLVLRVPGVASTHKIRSRGAPGAVFVDLHIQVAPQLDVMQAHRVTHSVIDAIKDNIEGVADVVVHTEPAMPDQPYIPLLERTRVSQDYTSPRHGSCRSRQRRLKNNG